MDIAGMIDHTLLRADATQADIVQLTEEAKGYHFASVCVNPVWVADAAKQLSGTRIKVCTVIGFPLGAATTAVKAYEAADAVANGATEVDMVLNVGALKAKEVKRVEQDMQAVVKAVAGKAIVKVIIETCLLTDEEKELACELAVSAGADFVKTSTGYSKGGATKEDIALMRRMVGQHVGVKASGGVRSLEDVNIMIAAGATRIGTSAGVEIVEGTSSTSAY